MPRRSGGGRSASRPAPRAAPVRNPHQTGRSASRPAPRAAPVRNPPQTGRSASRPAPPAAPVRNPPQTVNRAPGLLSTIARGMAFGIGSAVAHMAVDAVMGPRTIQHEAVVSDTISTPSAPINGGSDACGFHFKAFQDCLASSASEISKCQFYMDMLNDCKKNSSSMLSA